VALHKYKGPPVDMSVQTNEDGTVMSVMPPDLMVEKDVVLNSVQYIMNQGYLYYDNSLCKKHSVNNIPLKAMIDDTEHKERTAHTNTIEQVFLCV
jgi:exo-beta-1,3-glucanase (GH17 family)